MEFVFYVVLLWLVLCFVVASVANSKGRSGFVWLLISLVLSPVLALVLVLVLKQQGPNSKQRRCPECMEIVHRAALKCKHCHADLTREAPTPDRGRAPKPGPSIKSCKKCGHKMALGCSDCPSCGTPV